MILPDALIQHRAAHRTLKHAGFGLGAGFLRKRGITIDATDADSGALSVVLVLRGRGQYLLGNRHWPLGPGDVFLRLPGKPHSTRLDPASDWAECYLALDGHQTQWLIDLGVIDPDQPILHPGLDQAWIRSVSLMVDRLIAAPPQALPGLAMEMHRLIAALVQAAAPDADPEMESIRLELDRPEPPSLTELAARHRMSVATLRRRFGAVHGLSPTEYRLRRRLDHARDLLVQSELTISQIATQLGFASAFSFSTQFRQRIGIAPKAFRVSRRSGDPSSAPIAMPSEIG